MADLPIPSPQLVTAQDPQDRVSGGDVARSAGYAAQGADKLAAGLDQVSEGLGRAAVPLAEQAGRDAAAATEVTRDAQGNPIVTAPAGSFLLGRAGDAYALALNAGMHAKGEATTSQALNNIHLEHQGDPAGFTTAADTYILHLRGMYGNTPLGQQMVSDATELSAQHAIRLTDEKAATDIGNAKASVLQQIDDTKNSLVAIARQPDGIHAPQFAQGLDRLNGYYDALKANPLFKVPAEVAESERQRAVSTFQAEAMIGHLDATVTRQGKAAAQQFITTNILNNPDLKLPDNERRQLAAYGMAHLEFLSGEQRAQMAANRAATDDVLTRFKTGTPVADSTWDGLDQAARASGDDETRLKIEAARTNAALRGQDGLAPQQVLAFHFPTGVPGAGGAATPEYLSRVQQIEDPSGDPNATSSTGAKGLFQFTSGTWARYGGGGDPTNTRDATAAVVKLTNDNAAALTRTLGRAPTPGELYLAHQQGAAGAGVLLSNPSGNAAETLALAYGGDIGKAVNAIRVNGGDPAGTAGQFAQKWVGKFEAGGGAAPAGPAISTAPGTQPFTAAQIAANPFLASTQVALAAHDQANREKLAEKLGGDIEAGIKLGNAPSRDGLAAYMQIAGTDPAKFEAQTGRIGALLKGQDLAEKAANLPGGQGQALVDAARERAAGTDIYTGMTADFAQKRLDAHARALKTDPMGEAVRQKWAPALPAPLDPNNPATFGPAIAQRGTIAQSITARTGDPDQPALGDAEVPGVKHLLANGTTDAKLALLDAWSKLPQPIQQASFRKVGLNGSDEQTFAAAGGLYGTDPQAARDILDGHTQLKINPRFGPKQGDIDTALAASLPAADFGSGLTSSVRNAALALYAKGSATANDATQTFSQSRWDDAVNKVTGGVVDYRGAKVVVPRPGMTDAQFRTMLSGLTDADLAGSRTAEGGPLPASALKPSWFTGSSGWRLQSVAPGRYFVFSGDNAARASLRTDRLDARDPDMPFVLDLRDKAAAVMAGY